MAVRITGDQIENGVSVDNEEQRVSGNGEEVTGDSVVDSEEQMALGYDGEVSDESVVRSKSDSRVSVDPVEETAASTANEEARSKLRSRRGRKDQGKIEIREEGSGRDPKGQRKSRVQGKAVKKKETVIIVVAGKPHSGKSRSLNNIFFMDFDSKCSAYSVTHRIDYRRLLNDDYELIVVDTPGLGAVDKHIDEVKKEFESIVGELSYTLVYCHSVGPCSAITEMDGKVLRNLQNMLGKNVWQKCVILFTFSDSLRSEDYQSTDSRKKYQDILRDHARRLMGLLQKECGHHVPRVECVFDSEESEGEEKTKKKNVIVAVPVGRDYKEKKEKHKLIPKGVNNHENWKHRAFVEIVRKSDPLDRIKLLNVVHGTATVASAYAGGTLGALLGGVGGALVGVLLGGFPAIPGAIAGAALGAAAGGAGSAALAHGIVAKNTAAKEEKFERLISGRAVYPPQSPEGSLDGSGHIHGVDSPHSDADIRRSFQPNPSQEIRENDADFH